MKLATAFVLVAAIALPCGAADYAVDKGSWMLGGTVGFESLGGDLYENEDGDSETFIEFSPFAGYFVMPGLAVGTKVIFSSASQGDDKDTAFGVGPMVEYYLGGPYSKIFPFASARLGYVSHSEETKAGGETVEFEYTEMSYGFALGAVTMVSRNVAVRGTVFYTIHSKDQKKPEDLDSVDGNQMGLRLGIQSFIW
jgi:hypothetical protein